MKTTLTIILTLIILTSFGQNRYPIRVDNKYGYIDRLGNIKIEPQYEEPADFINGFALISHNDFWIQVIDTNGKEIFHFQKHIPSWYSNRNGKVKKDPAPSWYYYPHYFSNGLLAVYDTLTNKYGFIDTNGEWKIKPKYTHINTFKEGRAAVAFFDNSDTPILTHTKAASDFDKTIKWGFIDTNGILVIDTIYKEVSSFELGICRVDNKFIDLFGNPINIDTIANRKLLCRTQKENPNFHYQKNGKYISPNSNFYDCAIEAREFYDGISSSGKYGYVDCKNNWLIKPKFQNIRPFKNGFAGVQRTIADGQFDWGFIDCNGDLIIDFQYQEIGNFSKNLVPVCKNKKWGVVNEKNEVIIPFEYDNKWPFTIYEFKDDIILLYKNDKQLYLNRKGQTIWTEK
jgi:hypothetical protein